MIILYMFCYLSNINNRTIKAFRKSKLISIYSSLQFTSIDMNEWKLNISEIPFYKCYKLIFVNDFTSINKFLKEFLIYMSIKSDVSADRF